MHITKGYGFPDILQHDWSFPSFMNLSGKFPCIPKNVFMDQQSRPLYILIDTYALKLLPQCNYGLYIKDCKKGLCCIDPNLVQDGFL